MGDDGIMDGQITTEAQTAVDTARVFARETIAPNATDWELNRALPREFFKQAGDLGLCGLLVPPDHGGSGLGVLAVAHVMEALASADMAAAFGLVVHNNLASNIAFNGADHHKDAYLPDMVAGSRIGAFLLTEPQSGSDAAGLKVTARQDGDQWVLNGEKAWVTNGVEADILSVYAQTDPAQGARGIGCFLVERDTAGVDPGPAYQMLGGHAMGVNGIAFNDARLPDTAHFIPAGGGFRAALAGIDTARAVLAAMNCGMLKAGLDVAVETVGGRRAFGQALAEFQGIQWTLAEVATELEAARQLAFNAARLLDAGEDGTLAAAHAKKFATRTAFARLSDCMQVMGAWGVTHDYPLARHLACAKLAQYMDGTSEIQNVVIARKLLG
jgi:alkylation response protein AidB-like acyl-CoA dehydrogenase